MILEYPDDPVTFDKTTQYQFMSGEWMLVAPVYTGSFSRDSIYFPEGKWIDYWDGTVYEGSQFLNDYDAPVEKCPVFIKEGAIIPLYPEMLYDNQFPKDPMTLDIYPSGYSSFELYEDDGLSKEHRTGAYSKTLIESDGPAFGQDGVITVTIGEYMGDYSGKPAERSYMFEVHAHKQPDAVTLNWGVLQQYFSLEELQNAESGWYYDANDRLGIVYAKTMPLNTAATSVLSIDIPVETGENLDNNGMKVYPNPTNGKIRVSTEEAFIEEIKIFDMGGSLIEDCPSYIHGQTAELDLSSALDGIYVLEVKTDKGLYREKLVFQK
jgi:hypothetical protein